ncbi:MAG: hypothetical protein K6G00_06245 [Treponema sp.]|nr:hypothetical protein [Treponema sp.]
MSLTEFDQEAYDRHRRREGFEEGVEKKAKETARKMLADNLPIEKIVLYTGLTIEEVQALADNMPVMA